MSPGARFTINGAHRAPQSRYLRSHRALQGIQLVDQARDLTQKLIMKDSGDLVSAAAPRVADQVTDLNPEGGGNPVKRRKVGIALLLSTLEM